MNNTTDTNQASELFELCREVYEATEWDDESLLPQRSDESPFNKLFPRYTSDYLLEKLPYTQSKKSTARTNRLYYLSIVAGHSTGGWLAGYHRIDNRRSESVPYWWGVRNIIVGKADTPLKALLKLTIALSEAGELK